MISTVACSLDSIGPRLDAVNARRMYHFILLVAVVFVVCTVQTCDGFSEIDAVYFQRNVNLRRRAEFAEAMDVNYFNAPRVARPSRFELALANENHQDQQAAMSLSRSQLLDRQLHGVRKHAHRLSAAKIVRRDRSSSNGTQASGLVWDIPYQLHQTWKASAGMPAAFSAYVNSWTKDWGQGSPSLPRTFWTDDQIAEFVERQYPMFFPVFAAITVPVMKADLFR